MEDTAGAGTDVVERRRAARCGLAVFFGLVIIFEAAVLATLIATGNPLWIYALMWSVAISSIVARLVLREGFSDVSFRWGGRATWWYIGFAFWFPLVVALVAWGITWLTGLAEFVPQATGLTASLVDGSSPLATFVVSVLLSATVGALVGAFTAAGEEIGWRGYMITRMIDAGVPRPLLVSGVVWGLWHLPLIFAGIIYADHPYVLLGAVVFVVSATSMNYVLSWVRLQTGSIWPPTLLHAAYNSITQSAFMAATVGGAVWIGGEVGIVLAAVLVLAAVIVCRCPWAMLRAPGEPIGSPSAAPARTHQP
jgi:membrane protease YdiL (CAAX protease family)